MTNSPPLFVIDAPARKSPSAYPEPYASMMAGRTKQPLGDLFGLTNFGVNLTTLAPQAISALHHNHSKQDEFIYILSGEVLLHFGEREEVMKPGMVMGFAADGSAHHLENRSAEPVTYLEIGDRTPCDIGSYPNDDLVAKHAGEKWVFERKDGRPY